MTRESRSEQESQTPSHPLHVTGEVTREVVTWPRPLTALVPEMGIESTSPTSRAGLFPWHWVLLPVSVALTSVLGRPWKALFLRSQGTGAPKSWPLDQQLTAYLVSCPGSILHLPLILESGSMGFPSGAVVENPPANAGDMGSSPGPGRSHMPRSN